MKSNVVLLLTESTRAPFKYSDSNISYKYSKSYIL